MEECWIWMARSHLQWIEKRLASGALGRFNSAIPFFEQLNENVGTKNPRPWRVRGIEINARFNFGRFQPQHSIPYASSLLTSRDKSGGTRHIFLKPGKEIDQLWRSQDWGAFTWASFRFSGTVNLGITRKHIRQMWLGSGGRGGAFASNQQFNIWLC